MQVIRNLEEFCEIQGVNIHVKEIYCTTIIDSVFQIYPFAKVYFMTSMTQHALGTLVRRKQDIK